MPTTCYGFATTKHHIFSGLSWTLQPRLIGSSILACVSHTPHGASSASSATAARQQAGPSKQVASPAAPLRDHLPSPQRQPMPPQIETGPPCTQPGAPVCMQRHSYWNPIAAARSSRN
eukprot:1161667-Pelagomonas_calceolata.AAC.12